MLFYYKCYQNFEILIILRSVFHAENKRIFFNIAEKTKLIVFLQSILGWSILYLHIN